MEKAFKFDPYNIVESDIKIEDRAWDDDNVQNLWMRHTLITQKMFDFWQPYYTRGKSCFDYEKGVIFTSEDRAKYKQEEKVPIEPRLIESKIYALVGQILRGRRSGSITTEGGSLDNPADSAAACEIASIVMKDMEKKFKERVLEKDILHNALVSSFYNWIWIEKGLPSKGEGVLRAKLLPWDSVAVAPFHFRYQEDITALSYRSFLKESELIDYFPEMEGAIKSHRMEVQNKDFTQLTSASEWDNTIDAAERAKLYSTLALGTSNLTIPEAFYEVITRVFQLLSKEKIAINLENPSDFHVQPPDWEEDRWQDFISTRAKRDGVEYTMDEREVTTLWHTVGTTSGLMVYNKKHWYQENGRMPGAMYFPDMIDYDITGHGEKMMTKLLMTAIAQTEFIDEVRKGSGSVWVTRGAYISNADEFAGEISKSGGVINVKQDFPGPLSDVVTAITRKPNPAMLEYANQMKAEIEEEGLINRSIQGETAPSQSGIAKTMEIAQGMISQTTYVENFNTFWEELQDVKCSLIPYGYDEHDIIEIVDERTGVKVKTEINAPMFDITGEIRGVANDLTSHDFKFKLQPVDDSPTAKAEEQRQALIFLNSVPGPLATIDPSGELLSYFMMAMPNRILQDAGKRLIETAKQRAATQQQAQQIEQLMKANESLQKLKNEAETIKARKVMFSVTGEQLAQYPALAQLLNEIGYFQPADLSPAVRPQEGLPPSMAAAGGVMPQQ